MLKRELNIDLDDVMQCFFQNCDDNPISYWFGFGL